MKHVLAFILIYIIMCACAQAQNDVNVTHTYVYHASYNESREQAERNAVNCAKNEALRERFGTIVSGASASSLITKNNITKSKFVSMGGEGEANGEWIADLEEPKITTVLEDGGFCVTATVRGKAREITNNPIGFEAKILRNEPKLSLESTEFTAGNVTSRSGIRTATTAAPLFAIMPARSETPRPAIGFANESKRLIVFASCGNAKDALTTNSSPVYSNLSTIPLENLSAVAPESPKASDSTPAARPKSAITAFIHTGAFMPHSLLRLSHFLPL